MKEIEGNNEMWEIGLGEHSGLTNLEKNSAHANWLKSYCVGIATYGKYINIQ